MSTKKTVLLCMILKNEAHIIERCLTSALPYIDGYFIIDTGSTDDTIAVVQNFMDKNDVPGEIIQEPWTSFGVNRTSLVQQARHKGYDYLLLGDADHVFDGELGDLTADSYLIRLPGSFEYWMPYLVRADMDWEYISPTHEFLSCPGEWLQERHPSFVIYHFADGGTRPEKFERDRQLLEDDYVEHPDSVRTVFYLAQTCKDQGDLERSKELYAKRASMGGWDEEVYWSLFQVAEITQDPLDYLKAWCFRPSRPEAVHRLMKRYNELELYRAAYVLGLNARLGRPSDDILFVEKWCQDWGIDFERAIAAWYVGEREESISLFKEILTRDDVPDMYRDSCRSNLVNCGVTDFPTD